MEFSDINFILDDKFTTAEVKTGTRRLMEFLLAPLMRGVSEGARER